MNMVKLPECSVQPAELDFAVCLVVHQLFNLEKFLFDALLPPSGGNSSMLDHGKISNKMRIQVTL